MTTNTVITNWKNGTTEFECIGPNGVKTVLGTSTENKKIASIGLRFSGGRSYHGISINVDMNLTPFSLINPCGYEGLEVTQISEFDSNVTLEDVKSVAIKEIQTVFS